MKKREIIRAWRDGEFYAELDADQKAQCPESPASLLSVDDDALRSVTGGCSIQMSCPTSAICTPCPPKHCY